MIDAALGASMRSEGEMNGCSGTFYEVKEHEDVDAFNNVYSNIWLTLIMIPRDMQDLSVWFT